MKDSTKRLYSSLMSLGFIAGSFYMYFSLIVPEFSSVQALRGERLKKQINLAEYKKASEETKKIQLTYQSVKVFKSNLSQLLPVTEEIPSLMNQVYGLAALNRVAVSGVDFQTKSEESSARDLVFPLSEIVVSVRFAAKYDDAKRFIKDLESNMRIFDITSASISGGGKKDPVLDINLSFNTYYQPKPSQD